MNVNRRTVSLFQDQMMETQLKAEKFMKEILDAAVEHIGLDKADTTVGTITFKEMMMKKILKLANLNNYDFEESVLLDSMFVLTRDAKGGFYVEQIFKDKNLREQQVVLHRFYLSQGEILEMRQKLYCNAVFINGNLQFRVYQFIKLLNTIIGKTNVFQRLNPALSDKEQKDRERKRREREKNR